MGSGLPRERPLANGATKTRPVVILLILCTFAFGATASARLGETEKQCEARYGAPIHYAPSDPKTTVPGTEERWFRKHPFYVRVVFRHGKAVYLCFENKLAFFGDDAEKAVLEANQRGPWRNEIAYTQGHNGHWFHPQSWSSPAGDRIAYRLMGPTGRFALVVADKAFHEDSEGTLAYGERKAAQRKQEEHKKSLNLKGF